MDSTIIKILFMLGGYSRTFPRKQCKIQLFRSNLGGAKVPGERFFRLSESLKSKILATMVPSPTYTGFVTNLAFWATKRLERLD